MERRLLLVFALTFLVIILFQPLLKKYMPQTATPAPETPAAAQPSAQPAAPSPAAPQVQVPAKGASKQAAAEAETVVENDLYRVTFTNRGGLVKSWILKTYFDETRPAARTGQQGGGEIRIPAVAVDLRRGPAQ